MTAAIPVQAPAGGDSAALTAAHDADTSTWSRRRLLSRRTVDAAAIAVSISAGFVVGTLLDTRAADLLPRAGSLLLLGLAWFVALRVTAPHERRRVAAARPDYRSVVGGTAAAFGVLAAIAAFVPNLGLRVDLLVTLPLGLGALLAGRAVWRARLAKARAAGRHLPRAVIVGTGSQVDFVIRQLGRTPIASYAVGGIVRIGDVASIAELPESDIVAYRGAESVREAALTTRADAVIVAGGPEESAGFLQSLAWQLERTSTELVLASALDSVSQGRIFFDTSAGLPLIRVASPTFSGGKHIVKRAMDIAVSGLALLVAAPAMGVLALLVRFDSKGPALFRQERIGVDGNTFTMFKFRSMVVTAEADLAALLEQNEGSGVLFKLKRDPRVTRIGAIMRKYSLDELPQLWNIFIGDMSLVGPRPSLAREVAEYEEHVHRRLNIKPGLTGAWQVSGRSDLSWDESVRLDLLYVENWSIWGDLKIIMRTVKVVVDPAGAY